MVECDCCGYDTLKEKGSFEMCYLCWWEADPVQSESNADEVVGGPNERYSLTEARKNFRKYLIMFDRNDPRFAQSGVQIEAKKDIINAFESIKTSNFEEERQRLRHIIEDNKQILEKERRRLFNIKEAKWKIVDELLKGDDFKHIRYYKPEPIDMQAEKNGVCYDIIVEASDDNIEVMGANSKNLLRYVPPIKIARVY